MGAAAGNSLSSDACTMSISERPRSWRFGSAISSAVRQASRGDASRDASSSSSARRRAWRRARRVSQLLTGASSLDDMPSGWQRGAQQSLKIAAATLKKFSRSLDEAVAGTRLRHEEPWTPGIRLELLPQLRDVDVQVVRLVAVGRPPDLAQDDAVRQ